MDLSFVNFIKKGSSILFLWFCRILAFVHAKDELTFNLIMILEDRKENQKEEEKKTTEH